MAKAERALVYADSSALVKLVAEERESRALRRFTEQADLVSCELALAEIPRAIRRAAAGEPRHLGRALQGAAARQAGVRTVAPGPE